MRSHEFDGCAMCQLDCVYDVISYDGFYMRFPSSVEYQIFSLDTDEKSVYLLRRRYYTLILGLLMHHKKLLANCVCLYSPN
jgi:hypothetical protein